MGPEHKDLVLAALHDHPDLAGIVIERDWVQEASVTLKGHLSGARDFLPVSVVEAVVSLGDPTTHADLVRFLVHGRNRASTYQVIRTISGLPLDEAVGKAWLASKAGQGFERDQFAAIASRHGHKDAIEALVSLATDPTPSYPGEADRAADELHRLILGPVPRSDLRRWHRQRSGELKFDSSAGTWLLPGGDESGNTPASPSFRARLAAIRLPNKATKAQAEGCVEAIAEECTARLKEPGRTWQSLKPAIQKLAAVGPDHLDLLLNLCEDGHRVSREAIRSLAATRHKEVLIRGLIRCPKLFDIIDKFGWVEDAGMILRVQVRRRSGWLPPGWIEAVADMRDPTTYEGLAHYVIHRGNRRRAYHSIKNIPEIDLTKTVAKAWKRTNGRGFRRRMFASVALAHGHPEALVLAVRGLGTKKGHPDFVPEARASILSHTEVSGENNEIRRWFKKSQRRLVFAKESQDVEGRNERAKVTMGHPAQW